MDSLISPIVPIDPLEIIFWNRWVALTSLRRQGREATRGRALPPGQPLRPRDDEDLFPMGTVSHRLSVDRAASFAIGSRSYHTGRSDKEGMPKGFTIHVMILSGAMRRILGNEGFYSGGRG